MLEANPGDAFADGKSAGPRGQDQIIARELPAIVVCSGLGGGVGGVESEKIGWLIQRVLLREVIWIIRN